MFRCSNNWRALTNFTSWVDQIDCIDEFATSIALVSSSILIIASFFWTLSKNKSISKWHLACFAILLLYFICISVTIFLTIQKDILSDLCLLTRGCSTKVIKIDIEPFIYLFMNFKEFITDFFTRKPHF